MPENHKTSTKQKIRVMKTPESLDLYITSQCNLRCTYCSHFSSESDVNKDLPTDEWLQFFKELGECAVKEVTFLGGEPFYRKDIKELIKGIVDNRMRFAFLSNGTLITEDLAKYISETGRCNSIQVSIDGPGPESHDIFRGDGSFVKAVEGLKIILKHHINPEVRVTIHKRNLDHLEEIAKLLLDDIGLAGFSTNSASHMGLCRKNEDMVQLNPEEFSRAMQILYELNRKYDGRISGLAGPLANASIWVEMENARLKGLKGVPGCGYLRACSGVFKQISVRADGIYTPCSQINHLELGRINRDSLLEIWQNHPELTRLRERQNVPLGKFKFCQGCEYIPYCRGGCPALAYTITGKDGMPAPDMCLRRFLKNGGYLPKVENQ